MDESRTCVDREWIRSAVAQYERQLTTYTLHIIKDADRARDVVQEAFLKLCSANRGEVGPRLPQWLYTVCRNLSIDTMRKERRMFLLSEAQSDSFEGAGSPPGDAVEREETFSVVLRSMADLPQTQQEAIRLKFQHDLSYKQIAEILNLTVTNVGFLIHTGLKTLRHRLGDTKLARSRNA